ncbi:hypothetical protein ACFPN2_25150 [Steroidobacter flavus]|uniref:Uncharacterized protein n=1 Tax=Steroidobacter flavus TaxID=1842136 RepID=A0ABV8SZ18_9GAMM
MSYTLQVIVGASDMVEICRSEGLAYVALTDRLALVPLNLALRERFDIPNLPLTDEDEEPVLPESLGALGRKLSKDGTVAYLEAQFFGGAGSQAHVLFRQGTMIGEPVVAGDAINQALRQFGVQSSSGADEFDGVGLGRHRHTDRWLTDRK